MARRRRSREPNRRSPSRPSLGNLLLEGLRPYAWRAMPVAVGLLIVWGAGWLGWCWLQRAPAFRVQYVAWPQSPTFRTSMTLGGRPIFSMNLMTMQRQLEQENPRMRRIRLHRVLPHTIVVEAFERVPMAQLRLREYHPVDEDGFIFAEGAPRPWPQLPLIEGMDARRGTLQPGRLSQHPQLQLGLQWLQRMVGSATLSPESIQRVTVGNGDAVTVVDDHNVELRFAAHEDPRAQFARLAWAREAIAKRDITPRYIDVRFDEPVIGPR